jgi:hypothetical protein
MTKPETVPAAVTDFFAGEDWEVNVLDDAPAPAVRGGFRGSNGEWFVDVLWFNDVEQLVVHSTVSRPVPDDRRAAVAGYMTFVNYGMPIGNLELSPVTGDLRYKTGVAVAAGELTADMVARQVYVNVLAMNRYLPGVVQVVWGTEPAVAYASIES